MSDSRLVKKRYISMSVALVGFSLILFMLPNKYSSKELKPKNLLLETINNSRFISTDEVADDIIKGDHFIRLIDVRTPEEFKKFHLKGAMNIPLADIITKDEEGDYKWGTLFDSESGMNKGVTKNIFYSNGGAYSNQAWMTLKRLNFKNIYVMKGGLNTWVETIMYPKKPNQTLPDTEFALYSKRKAASMFFGKGGASAKASTETTEDVAPIIIKKEEKEEEGGC